MNKKDFMLCLMALGAVVLAIVSINLVDKYHSSLPVEGLSKGIKTSELTLEDYEGFPMSILNSLEYSIPYERHYNTVGLRGSNGKLIVFKSEDEQMEYLKYLSTLVCNQGAIYTATEAAIEDVYQNVNEVSLEYFRAGEVY